MCKWYEQYRKLASPVFTAENDGRLQDFPPPFTVMYDKDSKTVDIQGKYGMDKEWGVMGYTENPPYQPAGYEAVGIMFESTVDFLWVWFHYPKY